MFCHVFFIKILNYIHKTVTKFEIVIMIIISEILKNYFKKLFLLFLCRYKNQTRTEVENLER